MSAAEHRLSWLRAVIAEHWVPLLILVVPINIAVGVWVSEGPWFALVLVVPITSLVLGWVLRPQHIWIVWIGTIVTLWLSMGLWGRYADPGPDETVTSLMLEAIIWMTLGVALPLWTGRALCQRRGHFRA